MKFVFFAAPLFVAMLSGCTTLQKINKVDASKMSLICIAEHKEVRDTVLEVIQEGLTNHGMKYRVIPASYQKKNNLWLPTVQDDQVVGCDALLFYVANWTWDITMYMHFANIWMSTPDRSKSLGLATYDARLSLNKFINARNKLLELIDGLFEGQKNANLSAPRQGSVANSPVPVEPSKSVDTAPNSTSQKLRELKSLRDEGLISEEDYQKKKKQLLEQF